MAAAKSKKLQSTWMQRYFVKAKLKAPTGITLSPVESQALADVQMLDVRVLKDNQQEVLSAISATRIGSFSTEISKAVTARGVAARTYQITKDPIKKREWARRLVVATETERTLVGVKDRMETTRDRLEMIKGDIELQLYEAEARYAESQAYAKAGKQLRLVGEKLMDARRRASTTKVEYSNLEITMEGAEKMVNDNEAEALLLQADQIINEAKVEEEKSEVEES